MIRLPPISTLFPYTTLFRSGPERAAQFAKLGISTIEDLLLHRPSRYEDRNRFRPIRDVRVGEAVMTCGTVVRSEEHTSELQSHSDLVCRLLLEKKKKNLNNI